MCYSLVWCWGPGKCTEASRDKFASTSPATKCFKSPREVSVVRRLATEAVVNYGASGSKCQATKGARRKPQEQINEKD